MTAAGSAPFPIAFLTDIEGQGGKLRAFARESSVLAIDAGGKLALRTEGRFVFGGDAIDHGPEGRWVVAALLDLKRRFPDRVTLLAGNRDLNKMRLVSELAPQALANPPRPFLEWLPESGFSDPRDPAARLRWIFSRTMGAARAFENRRTELGGGDPERAKKEVEDLDVVRSYLSDLGEGGPLREYLRATQLMARFGNTLFVHGAVTRENLLQVPEGLDGWRGTGSVDEWEGELNAWKRGQLDEWAEGREPAPGRRPGDRLLRYQEPRTGNHGVVYARYSDSTHNPVLPPREAIRRLQASGVARVVSGHTPQSSCPSILRAEGFEVILADNTLDPSPTQLEIASAERTRVRALARPEGEEPSVFSMDWSIDERSPLGKRLEGAPDLVTARLSEEDWLLFRVLPGFKTAQRRVSSSELARQALREPFDPS